MTDTEVRPASHAAPAPDAAAAIPASATPAPEVAWGDPFPLGLASFGISALVLSFLVSGILDAGATPVVIPLALALGFGTELIAGIIHFRRGETFPALVFVAYSGFWLSYALFVQFYGARITADAVNATGTYLLAWGIFSTYMLLAALRTNLTTIAIFVLLSAVFYLDAIGTYAGSTGLVHVAGYLLIVDAALALYASAAIIVNTTWERPVLPVP